MDEIKLLEAINKDVQPSKQGEIHCAVLLDHFWHTGPNGKHKCLVFPVLGENLL